MQSCSNVLVMSCPFYLFACLTESFSLFGRPKNDVVGAEFVRTK